MLWDSGALFAKAQLYFSRAYREERESSLFGTWMGLGVEHLARAALASVHQVLLADPQDGKNILHAFGVETRAPRSVPSKTVLSRCVALFEEFTEEHERSLKALLDLRNEELHSGVAAFEGVPLSSWYTPALRAVTVLARQLDRTLEDLMGPEEAVVASRMLAEASDELRAEVLRAIAKHRASADLLDQAERELRRQMKALPPGLPTGWHVEKRGCPACSADVAQVAGPQVRELPPLLEDGDVLERSIYLPMRMACPVCELDLTGHERLSVAGAGDTFTVTFSADAEEYFGSRYEDRYDGYQDYGND